MNSTNLDVDGCMKTCFGTVVFYRHDTVQCNTVLPGTVTCNAINAGYWYWYLAVLQNLIPWTKCGSRHFFIPMRKDEEFSYLCSSLKYFSTFHLTCCTEVAAIIPFSSILYQLCD